MKKRLFVFSALIIVVALMSACAAQPAAEEPAEQPAAAFKAGLLAPGPVNDGGWNQTAYEALQRMETLAARRESLVASVKEGWRSKRGRRGTKVPLLISFSTLAVKYLVI